MAQRGRVKLLVTPLPRGNDGSYAAYLLVPATDTNTSSLEDLRGKVFAFADPYSLTGYQVARVWLKQMGEHDPNHFFRKTFFTRSHLNTINAVVSGLADGGLVDSYAWDLAVVKAPALENQLRIAARSNEFGFPPIVSVSGVAAKDAAALRSTLLTMGQNEEGQQLLQKVGLSGFVVSDPRRYRNLAAILDAPGKP
jgi:phosphonate transport system substrate-binding protein